MIVIYTLVVMFVTARFVRAIDKLKERIHIHKLDRINRDLGGTE